MAGSRKPPAWFGIAAILFVLWSVAGCYACYRQVTLGAEAMGPPTAYQRTLYASLPGWYNPVYAVAVGAGLLGALALLARSRAALSLFAVSLVGIVVMFGWMFLATDIIARMGFATAAGFPIVIALVAVLEIALARRAAARGWIG